MKKAFRLEEIDAAVNKFRPVTPEHEFYVNFENARGDFQERQVMRILNVNDKGGKYIFNYQANRDNKTFLFLAGMRGSGKTSELAKYAKSLNSPECFLVVTCNIDEDLDMNNVEYMDILIFQLERLVARAQEIDLKMSHKILDDMAKWFQERVLEINRNLQAEGSAEIETDMDKSFSVAGIFGRLLGLTAKLKAGLSGTFERKDNIRTSFKNRFSDFASRFNDFIERANEQLRRENKGLEVLFIVDGLEKTMSAETRRKIIMEESNRIRQIRANTIFTLPIELMKEEPYIRNFGEIITFPFIKIKERDGKLVESNVRLFEEFVRKRIDEKLFDSAETVRLAIEFSGGSPRQLQRILEQANWQASPEVGIISKQNMKRAIEILANSMARYIEPADFEVLRNLKTALDAGLPIGFDSAIQNLLEKEIIFEYNDGTYKRVNPLVEVSKLYKHHVARQA